MPLACHPGIAFDQGEAYTEEAGSLRFGYPALEGFDYLCAKISRIGSHSSMVASGSMLLTDAVDRLSVQRLVTLITTITLTGPHKGVYRNADPQGFRRDC